MKLSKTHILAVANQKGGCGKTTTSVNLAAAFTTLGYTCCLVDNDQQCNASLALGVKPEDVQREKLCTIADLYLRKRPATDSLYTFQDRFEGRMSLIPGNKRLGSVPARLDLEIQQGIAEGTISELDADDVRAEHRTRLKQALGSLVGEVDLVIIDTAPKLDFLLASTLIASAWVVIPVQPSDFDLQGLKDLHTTINKTRQRFNPDLRIAGLLLTRRDNRTVLDKQIYELLQQRFGSGLFDTVIDDTVRLREAPFYVCIATIIFSPRRQLVFPICVAM